MSDEPAKDTNSKEYGLRAADRNMLIYVRNHLDAIFSGLISTIAIDRFGYNVTEHTKFNIDGEFNRVTITEVVPDEKPAGADDSPIKTAKESVQSEADTTSESDIQSDSGERNQPEAQAPEASA